MILNEIELLYQSINAVVHPNDSAVIVTVNLYPNISYATNNISSVHSIITESSRIASCHVINGSVYSAVYISNG